MALCKAGHIYIVNTVLTKPPKPKFALCVCVNNGFFCWINSLAKSHGKDQLALHAGCHELVTKDCFLDLSRVVKHPGFEMEDAKEFSRISTEFASRIVTRIDAGLFIMPSTHSSIVRETIASLL